MQHILVFYDVQQDRTRNKVIETCLDYGLDRLQYSVFVGQLKTRQLHALGRELNALVTAGCHVFIIPIAANNWEKHLELGAPLHVKS